MCMIKGAYVAQFWTNIRCQLCSSSAQQKFLLLWGAAAILIILNSIGSAWSQPGPSLQTQFSEHERRIIERNVMLREAVTRNPVVVRRALDAIAGTTQPRTQRSAPTAPSARQPGSNDLTKADQSTNPDLNHLQRVAPEAAHDLFQLLKQVNDAGKGQR